MVLLDEIGKLFLLVSFYTSLPIVLKFPRLAYKGPVVRKKVAPCSSEMDPEIFYYF
jgi:hypothetical protein